MSEGDLYGLIGEEGFHRLVAAFYRQVPQDEILGSMYPADDLEGAEQRLRDFLIFRFGGPSRYLEERGHPRPEDEALSFPDHADSTQPVDSVDDRGHRRGQPAA